MAMVVALERRSHLLLRLFAQRPIHLRPAANSIQGRGQGGASPLIHLRPDAADPSWAGRELQPSGLAEFGHRRRRGMGRSISGRTPLIHLGPAVSFSQQVHNVYHGFGELKSLCSPNLATYLVDSFKDGFSMIDVSPFHYLWSTGCHLLLQSESGNVVVQDGIMGATDGKLRSQW